MAYCTKCGTENDDDAAFCKKCGRAMADAAPGPATEGTKAPPMPPPTPPPAQPHPAHHEPDKDWDKDCDKECENDCSRGGHYSWFWGAIVMLVGLGIILEFGIKNIDGTPDWVQDINIWWMIPVLIGVVIILAGISVMSRSRR